MLCGLLKSISCSCSKSDLRFKQDRLSHFLVSADCNFMFAIVIKVPKCNFKVQLEALGWSLYHKNTTWRNGC